MKRSCHGNHCKRLSISRKPDCEKMLLLLTLKESGRFLAGCGGTDCKEPEETVQSSWHLEEALHNKFYNTGIYHLYLEVKKFPQTSLWLLGKSTVSKLAIGAGKSTAWNYEGGTGKRNDFEPEGNVNRDKLLYSIMQGSNSCLHTQVFGEAQPLPTCGPPNFILRFRVRMIISDHQLGAIGSCRICTAASRRIYKQAQLERQQLAIHLPPSSLKKICPPTTYFEIRKSYGNSRRILSLVLFPSPVIVKFYCCMSPAAYYVRGAQQEQQQVRQWARTDPPCLPCPGPVVEDRGSRNSARSWQQMSRVARV
ncbi:hypothetical protein DV515_00001382 [Chloebia gouldiae]|uniref:Uncharacterized protein n=1 Tax=Chloebia gouldiae TaxID=44316 RepID=A0A3L8SZ79_CHLGU|nr:hypothetical protein DV515_00001382 [Chloebia gouldiae]